MNISKVCVSINKTLLNCNNVLRISNYYMYVKLKEFPLFKREALHLH